MFSLLTFFYFLPLLELGRALFYYGCLPRRIRLEYDMGFADSSTGFSLDGETRLKSVCDSFKRTGLVPTRDLD